ncbi:hypothetical protein EDB80DRAFT_692279 [Ilyonectria destructans]|nr:hypothetical protein EDB80DRAFT_692279 [Ilyonectria destructans]
MAVLLLNDYLNDTDQTNFRIHTHTHTHTHAHSPGATRCLGDGIGKHSKQVSFAIARHDPASEERACLSTKRMWFTPSVQLSSTRPAAMPTSHCAPENWMSDFIKKIALAPHDELRTQLGFLLAQNSSPHERRLFQARQKVFHFISQLNQTDRETGDDGEHTQPKGQNIDPIQTEQAVSRVKLIRQSFDEFVCDAESQVEGLSDPNDTEKFIFTKMSDPLAAPGLSSRTAIS